MKRGISPIFIINMLVFVYGTLVEPIIRDRILGHHVETTDAVLDGYVKVCGWDYLTLIPGEGSVKGVVFEAGDGDISKMDVWEEVPVYELVPVTVTVDGGSLRAHCYIMPEPAAHYGSRDESGSASIPLEDIIRDVESMFGRFHGAEDKDR